MQDSENSNTIESDYDDLKKYYNQELNLNKELIKTSNDEPTPIECIEDMMKTIPSKFWKRTDLKILDPCCGCGNFFIVIYQYLKKYHSIEHILTNMLYFNDTNTDRLKIVNDIFCGDKYDLNITNYDFLKHNDSRGYHLIVANPPYAHLLPDGKRASKNHNLIKPFIQTSLKYLHQKGYLLYLTPDNWMSYADRNLLIKELTALNIIHLNIHQAKKYFKKIGSSFTWYLIQNSKAKKTFTVEGIWKKKIYKSKVKSEVRSYIPLVYNNMIQSILHKTLDNTDLEKFKVLTSSDLHKYTKKSLISKERDNIFCNKLIHTPSQTVYANRPHKFQEGWKVFISTTTYYSTFVDNCGMTQSIAFIRCENEEDAIKKAHILSHPLYKFINDICRWGNFNNIRILQSFPICDDYNIVYEKFKITEEEQEYIKNN